MTTDAPRRALLGDQHYGVSDRATQQYADHACVDIATARVELVDLLRGAKASATRSDQWRLQNRTTGLDVTATTRPDRDRGHLVVVGITIREYRRR